jgi:hypothetical protein
VHWGLNLLIKLFFFFQILRSMLTAHVLFIIKKTSILKFQIIVQKSYVTMLTAHVLLDFEHATYHMKDIDFVIRPKAGSRMKIVYSQTYIFIDLSVVYLPFPLLISKF